MKGFIYLNSRYFSVFSGLVQMRAQPALCSHPGHLVTVVMRRGHLDTAGYEPRAEWDQRQSSCGDPWLADLACTPHIEHAAIRSQLSLYFLSRTRQR